MTFRLFWAPVGLADILYQELSSDVTALHNVEAEIERHQQADRLTESAAASADSVLGPTVSPSPVPCRGPSSLRLTSRDFSHELSGAMSGHGRDTRPVHALVREEHLDWLLVTPPNKIRKGRARTHTHTILVLRIDFSRE